MVIYASKPQDRVPLYLNIKNKNDTMTFYVPTVVYKMFSLSEYEMEFLEQPKEMLRLMISYFVSFYPYNVDDFGTQVSNPGQLIFCLASTNEFTEMPCLYADHTRSLAWLHDQLITFQKMGVSSDTAEKLINIIESYDRKRAPSS